jgi:dihydrofolate reductase
VNAVRKVCLFIAASLDGFIARDDGDIGWLSLVDRPKEDYGYAEFMKTVDTVLVGRKTYDKVRSLGVASPYGGRKCLVLSRSRTGLADDVEYTGGDLAALIGDLRGREGRSILIDGGGEVVQECVRAGLIDEFTVSIIPVLLGSGIPLFGRTGVETSLHLRSCRSFPAGLVQLVYERPG